MFDASGRGHDLTGGRFGPGRIGLGAGNDCTGDFRPRAMANGFPTGSAQITVEAWIRATVPAGAQLSSLAPFGYGTWRLDILFESSDQASIYWQSPGGGECTAMVPSASILDGAFHHLAGTHDSGTAIVYLDGVLVQTCSGFATGSSAVGEVVLLGLSATCNPVVDVGIDEVRVLDFASTAPQIAADFAQGLLTQIAGTVALWHFDDFDPKACCPAGSSCAPDGGCAPLAGASCPSGSEACGGGCCPEGGICSCAVGDPSSCSCAVPAQPSACPPGYPIACPGSDPPICCPEGYVCDGMSGCTPVASPLRPPEVGPSCGPNTSCPTTAICATPGTACCPSELPRVCGAVCCPPGQGCDPGPCGDTTGSACGTSVCASGIACTNGTCACPADHPVTCAGACCLAGAPCTAGICSCPSGRAACGDRCCAVGSSCVAGACQGGEPPPPPPCPGGLIVSQRSIAPGGIGAGCVPTDLPTEACVTFEEWRSLQGTELQPIAVGGTGCFDPDARRIVQPCQAGLTCVIGQPCEADASGTCLER